MIDFPPIAIVGQGCVLPDALSPSALWQLVKERRSAIGPAPESELRLPHGVDRAQLAREMGSGLGGYVRGFERAFDPQSFAVATEGLDPVFLWTLHAAREAAKSAGIEAHPRGIVILGNLSYPVPALVELALETWDRREGTIDPRNRFMSGLPAHLTARALGFGLGGFALDAACASSLYAIKLACDRLHDRTADVALAGGVNHADSLFLHLGFTALAAGSPTGRSRPFHRGADGIVPAQGAAMVVLERLEDAETSGRRILGVIRGVGLSNDGRGRGLLVPHEPGQIRAMRAAYQMSGIDPREISLVECHATGTPVGDATEVRSMRSVFERVSDLPIGSLKSNLGHLITASGAAALLKVLAAVEAGVRPPTLHAEEPIAELAQGPLRLLQESEPWTSDGPRRAAISNFGFGGNNAHLIVEEWTGRQRIVCAPIVRSPEPIAVIAQAIIRGEPAADFELDIGRLRFPPADLEAALPQQTLLLRVALELELEGALAGLDPVRTALIAGMQCDAEVSRGTLRWRRTDAAAGLPIDGPLTAAMVLGCMPNIVANRIGSQLDLEQPTFTVSADETSGPVALELAARALAARELDAAIVGAVDLSSEPVHAAAAARILSKTRGAPADAAVLLVLQRLSDARRDGRRVLATIEGSDLGLDSVALQPSSGHAHAASGLIEVARAVSACEERRRGAVPFLPAAAGERSVRVEVETFSGARTTTIVRADPHTAPRSGVDPTRLSVFTAGSMDVLIAALDGDRRETGGALRVAIVANGDDELQARTRRAAERLRTHRGDAAATLDEGIYFGAKELEGEVAFVFAGPAGAYPFMGRELALGLPELVDALGSRMSTMRAAAGWLYEGGAEYRATPVEKLWGSAFLIQLHAELTRGLLAIRPHAAIGYCSGETNALFALGAWDELDDFRRCIDEQAVYTRELSGELLAVRRAWNLPDDSGVAWSSLRVRARVEDVRRAVEAEPRVHLTIINAPADVVIAGDPAGCARVVEKLGAHRARSLDYDFVMHCPEARGYAASWRALHHRRTSPVPGVRFYTHATLSSYAPTREAVADALTGQAMNPVNFPALVERAWADGIRVFVEHGPHAGCTKWIDEVLADRPHLAVALDQYGRSSMLQAVDSVARLVAAGVPMDHRRLEARLSPPAQPARVLRRAMTFPAHFPPVSFPAQEMEPAPKLPILAWSHAEVAQAMVPAAPVTAPVSPLAVLEQQLATVHRDFLRRQAEVHAEFLRLVTPSSNKGPRGPRFTRADLETLASGKISSVFGPLFEQQDHYAHQVRMPEPPLLLADRVLEISGEPGQMGTGIIWTETDVTEDAWYLHQGRMPAGILVESGQADLLLISWLGVDFLNRGERVYRLLGCELTPHGELPKIGETLTYEIHVDGHANQGGVRLFFFHLDCRVNGALRLTVRNGQAGFFTREELAGSAGVLWSAEESKPTPIESAHLDPPVLTCTKGQFTREELDAFAAGDGFACFGPGFERLATHTLTPSIQSDRMRLLDEVTCFDPRGGPWGRGYLRARLALKPDHWFFAGHFKDDPCMPGTLMFEGSVQALSIYLAALGYTIARDGWRFEPVPGVTYPLRCRGQALPTSKEVIYEVFVDEIISGEQPTIYADLLGTVDGLKAFHCRRMGLRLVPAWPMDQGRLELAVDRGRDRPVASVEGFRFDHYSLLACALGRPTHAFGPMYAGFDGTRRAPRLPGPPYHFMTRIVRVDGPIGGMKIGSVVVADYDVPSDAWYFSENARRVMPYAVLLEVALQPCGWLASYIGSAATSPIDLVFRNLDGDGTVACEVHDDAGTLTTTGTLTSLSSAGGLIIVGFAVELRAREKLVYAFDTTFGFFTGEAMKNQVGLPVTEEARRKLDDPSDVLIDLNAKPPEFFTGPLRLPRPMLLMIDRITGLWPTRIRAEKDVDPAEWFFKAHFYLDPVQPGSLGLEAMLQSLQAFMIARGMGEGLADPYFEPIAAGTAMTWKYRGQVVPETRRVVTDLEITAITEDERGRAVVASGSLWADGKRIYEVRDMVVRIASRSRAFDRARTRAFWREVTGAHGGWAGEDLLFGLLDRFVGAVHVEDEAAIRGRPALYLANHQVGVETILAAIVLGGITGTVPMLPAKAEHQNTWVGQLLALLSARPKLHVPQLLRFVDREDRSSVLRLRDDLIADLGHGRSALVHVEGTRATTSRRPVTKLSSVFLDLAIDAGIDVVPVRFIGGLPIEASAERLELPVGHGRQDYWIGRPISAATLRALSFGARKVRVLSAINALGVKPEAEVPSAPAREVGAAIRAWRDAHGVSEALAAMVVALGELADLSDEGRALLGELRAGAPGSDPWRGKLASWLLGRSSR